MFVLHLCLNSSQSPFFLLSATFALPLGQGFLRSLRHVTAEGPLLAGLGIASLRTQDLDLASGARAVLVAWPVLPLTRRESFHLLFSAGIRRSHPAVPPAMTLFKLAAVCLLAWTTEHGLSALLLA